MIRAWHFLAGNKLRDGTTAPKDGEWLKFAGKPIMSVNDLCAGWALDIRELGASHTVQAVLALPTPIRLDGGVGQ